MRALNRLLSIFQFVVSINGFTAVPALAQESPAEIEKARSAGSVLSAVAHLRVWRKDRSKEDLIPVSAELKVTERTGDQTTFTYNGNTYRAQNEKLLDKTEVTQAPDAMKKLMEKLAQAQAQTAGALNETVCDTYEARKTAASTASCPLAPDGKSLAPGSGPWNDWTAHLVISKCAPEEKLGIVKRISSGSYSKNCRSAKDQDLSTSATWQACAPPPQCSPKQIEEKQRLAGLRLAQDRKLHCAKHGKDYQKIGDGDACMVPFETAPQRLVIHETGLDPSLGPHRIQRSKMEEGYDDIPYHFMIGPTPSGGWRVYEGRPLKYEGAHAGAGLNSDSLAIVIAGDYDAHQPNAYHPAASASQPPAEAVRLLASLVNDLKKKYPSLKTIAGHGEMKYEGAHCVTTCPSAECQKLVNRLRENYFDGLMSKDVPIHFSRSEAKP